MLAKIFESPLDNKEIQPVHPKGKLTDAEAETPIQYFGYLMRRVDSFIGKDPDAGRDLGQEEKGTTEDEMVG